MDARAAAEIAGSARTRRGAPAGENAILWSMTDDGTKRPPPISYRPPKEREEEFHARVAASGMSVNAFITESVFGRGRRSRGELQTLAQLLNEAARISDRLHDIGLTGPGNAALQIEAMRRELTEIRAALVALLGRKP